MCRHQATAVPHEGKIVPINEGMVACQMYRTLEQNIQYKQVFFCRRVYLRHDHLLDSPRFYSVRESNLKHGCGKNGTLLSRRYPTLDIFPHDLTTYRVNTVKRSKAVRYPPISRFSLSSMVVLFVNRWCFRNPARCVQLEEFGSQECHVTHALCRLLFVNPWKKTERILLKHKGFVLRSLLVTPNWPVLNTAQDQIGSFSSSGSEIDLAGDECHAHVVGCWLCLITSTQWSMCSHSIAVCLSICCKQWPKSLLTRGSAGSMTHNIIIMPS